MLYEQFTLCPRKFFLSTGLWFILYETPLAFYPPPNNDKLLKKIIIFTKKDCIVKKKYVS